MTLGFNFDMALHLPTSHSTPHTSLHHDGAQGSHPHHHSHLGYSSSYPIKYEPCESITSTNSPTTNSSSSGAAGIAPGFSLHHQQQMSSFERDFFESEMNGMQMPDSIHGMGTTTSCDSCSDAEASPLNSSPLGVSNIGSSMVADKRQIRVALGKSNSIDRKRPYPCKVCPSKFGSKMELEEHQNSHTGQKPFECEVCKSRFNRRSTLWNHKRIHSDAKPFVCTVCHMQFKWKNSLKCHKEMHIRKNETTVANDNDIRQLTYATAAKRRMLELEGGDSAQSVASLAIFSAASTSQTNNNRGGGGSRHRSGSSDESSKSYSRKKQKLIKKEVIEDAHKYPMSSANETQLDRNSLIESLTNLNQRRFFGQNEFGNVHNPQTNLMVAREQLGMDLNLDRSDFMNNQLLMQAIWNDGVEPTLNQLDFRSGQQNNPIFPMDDTPKMFPGGLFDIKDTLSLQSPNGNHATNPLSMALSLKPMLNLDLNSFNPLQESPRHRQNLPTINSFNDYPRHESAPANDSQFNLARSTASSSSTPSNGHQNNGHLNTDLPYQQSIDHALLLNTNHQHDYITPFEYMTPTGNNSGGGGSNNNIFAGNYSNHDLPLSALAASHDSLEHSPHSSMTRGIFYHSNLEHHHPGCLSSQIPAQQMR